MHIHFSPRTYLFHRRYIYKYTCTIIFTEMLLFISPHNELYWLINNHLLSTYSVEDTALALIEK